MNIIGITGAAGSGKDEAANILYNHFWSSNQRCFHLPFAKSLKEIATNIFGWDGEKDERGRKLLQVLGTDLARAYNPYFWIEKWNSQLLEYQHSMQTVILVPDVRFDNECVAIHDHKGIIIRLVGRKIDLGKNANHVSESGVNTNNIDYNVDNSGTKEDLKNNLLKVISEYSF